MSKFDIVIIGAGLGGLACGTFLSKEGYNVCVLEKNALTGGCFQSFRRNGKLLDTGIHYVGSMDEGEVLHQYFNYFGIINRIKTRRLDAEAFDVINYGGKEYPFAMGHAAFAGTLSHHFPDEEEALKKYVEQLRAVGSLIDIDHLKKGKVSAGGMEYFSLAAATQLQTITTNPCLQQVLAGSSLLYGGVKEMSTFYHHAMINNSYLQGACRFVDGSMQVTDALADVIRANGGIVRTRSEVTRLIVENEKLTAVEVNGEERIEADIFISNLHPRETMRLTDKTPLIKKAYISRMNTLTNSYGVFSVYLLMKKNSYPYINRNYYIHDDEDVWQHAVHTMDRRITSCLLSTQATSASTLYADVVTLLCPMYIDELTPWMDTTVQHRGAGYEQFKELKARQLIDFTERYYPGLKENIDVIYTTTPLTYRDYTGTPEGSAYGIIKDYRSPLTTLIPVRTKIENLLMTGQNLNVHGALGVTLTSMLTCAELLGTEYIAKKVGNA